MIPTRLIQMLHRGGVQVVYRLCTDLDLQPEALT